MTRMVDPARGCDVLTLMDRLPDGNFRSVYCKRLTEATEGNYNYCNGHMFLFYRNNRTEGGPDGDDLAYD
jgi:hypothetical protein